MRSFAVSHGRPPGWVARARGVALARGGGLFGRRRSARWRSRGRRGAANPPAFVRGGMARRLAAARSAGALSAAIVFVDGRPGATFGLLLRNAAAFVALLDMLRLPFLLVGVFRLVAAWHGLPPALRDRMLAHKPLTAAKVPPAFDLLPADGDKPKQNDRDADERCGDRPYDLKLQQFGSGHGELHRETAGSIVADNAAGLS